MSRGRAATAGLLALALGCSESTPTRRPRGLVAGEEAPRGPVAPPAAPAPTPQPAPPPRSSLPSPFMAEGPNPGALARADARQEPAPEPDAGSDAGPPRELAVELRAVLEPVPGCLNFDAVARAGGRITVTVVANVVPSGRITRASAAAPGQPASALRCLEERATRSNLRGPVPGAPLQVTATIPLELFSQPAPR